MGGAPGQGLQHEGALAEVVQRQARQGEEQPGGLDRPAAEVAHVGVKGFGARHGQEHRAQHQKAHQAMTQHEFDGVVRAQRQQHAGIVDDMQGADGADGDEPDQHHRSEQLGDAGGAPRLHHEQPDQDDEGGYGDLMRGHQIADLRDVMQALEGAQHRNGGGDHRIAVEKRGADGAEQEHQARPLSEGALGERHQRKHTAFALVVRAHHEQHIFERHHDQKRPDRQGHHAQHRRPGHRIFHRLADRSVERVERTGADIAEHHADRADRQAPEGLATVRV